MGRDKARVPVAGVAAATRVARALAPLCDELLLVGGEAPADAPGRRVIDGEGPRCALRGLVAALAAAEAPRVLVVATDLPLVTERLLAGLLAAPPADAVVPRADGYAQPLCALYDRAAALAPARAALAGGRLALRAVLDGLRVAWVEGPALAALDPDGTALRNVNTPEDLAAAEALLRLRA